MPAASSITPRYVRFAERGRTDFLRLLGTDARRLIDGSDSREPAAFVVRRMSFDFARPGRMDDLLEVETRVKELGGGQRYARSDDQSRRHASRLGRGRRRARVDFRKAAALERRCARSLSSACGGGEKFPDVSLRAQYFRRRHQSASTRRLTFVTSVVMAHHEVNGRVFRG